MGEDMQTVDGTNYKIMRELLEEIDSTTSPQDLCQAILKVTTKATSSKGCSLMLFARGKRALFRCAAYGLSDWFFKKSTVSTDPGISRALRGEWAVIKNVSLDNRVGYRKQVMKEGIASILNIPVKLEGRIIGAMQIYTAEERNFTDDEISMASMIANFGAEALEKAGFHEIVQRDYDAFKKSMKQMSSELGYEWESEPGVMPAEDKGPLINAGG
jgi:signal transduction protein with GAF and PtsI domain